MTLMLPALFGVGVSQLNLMLDTILASFLETGSVSWLYYSDRLMELPLGVFGIAIATVILPSLSRKHAEKSVEDFSHTLDWALRSVMLVGLPAAVALFYLATPILATLFQYGEFSETDVTMAAQSLRAYAAGVLAFMLIKVLAPGYFSRQDTKTPVKIAVKAMVVNMVLNLALIGPLAHAGLALATSIAALLNAGLLYLGLRRSGVYQPGAGWGSVSVKLVLSCTVMLLVLVWLNPSDLSWMTARAVERALWMTGLVVVGAGVYFGCLGILGMRLKHFKARSL